MIVSAIAAAQFAIDPAAVYHEGEAALQTGDFAAAERAFREVIRLDPGSIAAHGNLAVVYMRKRAWPQALAELKVAELLAPRHPGIQLDIGLVHYRQGHYQTAIPRFEAVLQDQPQSAQARFLLGFCFFFLERYVDSLRTLEPIWESQQSNLPYLYVLSIAAGNVSRPDLEKKAMDQLFTIGHNSPEVHLLIGKSHLTHGEDAAARQEFEAAMRGNARLPFAHYYLGVLERQQKNWDAARAEFRADLAIEPDVALDHEQLGAISSELNQTAEAEAEYREALRLEPRLATAHYALAKLLRKQGQYTQALREADAAAAIDGDSSSLRYLRAQILQKLGRAAEAKREFAASAELRQKVRDDLERRISGREADPQVLKAPE